MSKYVLNTDAAAHQRYVALNDATHASTLELLQNANINSYATVLELGCGIGLTAIELAKKIVPNGKVIALDQSAQQIEFARTNAVANGCDNIEFVTASALDYDYATKVDCVHTRMVLTHISQPELVIEKVHKALNPGGVFIAEEMYNNFLNVGAVPWFITFVAWFVEAINKNGGDADFGSKCFAICRENKFADISCKAYFPVNDQATFVNNCYQALTEIKPNLLQLNIATDAEINTVLDAMLQHDANSSCLSWQCLLQTTARKAV